MSDAAPAPPRPSRPIEDALPTAIEVLTDPRGFFASLDREGGYEQPAMFAGLLLIVHAAILALFPLVRFGLLAAIATLMMTPLFGAIGLLIGAAIVLIVSRALGGEATFESSFRIVAYSSAILPALAIATLIPYLPILVQAYAIYLCIIAVIAVHKVDEQRAWTVIGGIGAVLLVLMLISTMTARRLQPKLEELGEKLERSAEELGRASDSLQRELDDAEPRPRTAPPPER